MIRWMTMIEATTSAAICPLMPLRLRRPGRFMMRSQRVDRGREHVAAGAHRLDHGGILRIAFDLAPDAADQHVDRALERTGVAALGEIEQIFARQHTAGALAEGAQQVEL